MAKYIELIDKYEIRQPDSDYNPPSYIWVDNTGEVVRCKDCRHWRFTDEGDFGILYGLCPYVGETNDKSYCDRGDRKDG